jgi:predicted dehydrogenase
VRYAVVGLGYIAQAAVLPAFAHARTNSRLVALVSSDPDKLDKLGRKYKVAQDQLYSYDRYDELLNSGEIDAVYIALPNNMHADYSVRAADAGIHVLCEKPIAMTDDECLDMLAAAQRNNVKLMVAYRLHFEEANLKAVEIVNSGQLGDVRLFNSVFTMKVKDDNVRLVAEKAGGALYDIGIYCINAARYIFRDEPTEVFAFSAKHKDDPRFREVDEMTTAVMRFPDDRLAAFTCSFGASDVSSYRVVGTKGELCVEPAFEYAEELTHCLTINGRTREKTFRKRDQFAPELIHFSECILTGDDPGPSGQEGMADVRIIRALYESASSGLPVSLKLTPPDKRPDITMEIKRPPVREPQLVHADSPTEG